MALPKLPPPIDIPTETKRAIIDGLKQVVALFQEKGLLDTGASHTDVLHDHELLFKFLQVYRENQSLAAAIAVDKDGKPVTDPDSPLRCGVSLAQIQQLMVKTCARHFLDRGSKDARPAAPEAPVMETVTKRRFLFFKTTRQVERKVERKAGGGEARQLREVLRHIAFDWQLPLLSVYGELSLPQLLELGEDILALRTPEAVRELLQFDHVAIHKAKDIAGKDFVNLLEARPLAIRGTLEWPREMYAFFRGLLVEKAFDFLARDPSFFMVVAALEKPLLRVYGDVLVYIAPENLEEMQRLNIDKADVLVSGMKAAFGPMATKALAQPNFARDVLRRLVEALLHMDMEKDRMLASTQVTCKAIAPQVRDWLAKQPPL